MARKRNKPLTDDDRAKIFRLYTEEGLTLTEIAKRFNRKASGISRAVKRVQKQSRRLLQGKVDDEIDQIYETVRKNWHHTDERLRVQITTIEHNLNLAKKAEKTDSPDVRRMRAEVRECFKHRRENDVAVVKNFSGLGLSKPKPEEAGGQTFNFVNVFLGDGEKEEDVAIDMLPMPEMRKRLIARLEARLKFLKELDGEIPCEGVEIIKDSEIPKLGQLNESGRDKATLSQ